MMSSDFAHPAIRLIWKKAKFGLMVVVAAAMMLQAGLSDHERKVRPCDILIQNGRVLDGAGNPWARLNVWVTGERITFVGDAKAEEVKAAETLDVHGLIVAPGFIDLHSHLILSSEIARAALPDAGERWRYFRPSFYERNAPRGERRAAPLAGEFSP